MAVDILGFLWDVIVVGFIWKFIVGHALAEYMVKWARGYINRKPHRKAHYDSLVSGRSQS
jgi:hypothetical protein